MKRILIVDDDKDLLYNLEHILSKKGYEIFTAANGEDAITSLTDIRPDLVLLDIHAGKMDGPQVCMLVKANPLTNHTPVILISADIGNKEIRKICKADDFIEKPFKLALLFLKISALIG